MKGRPLFLILSINLLVLVALSSIYANSNDTETTKPFVVINPTEEHKNTLIFLHGAGQNGSSWLRYILPMNLTKNWKLIFPTAPKGRVIVMPGKLVNAWYEVLGIGPNVEEDVDGIHAAAQQVHSWIEQELKESNLTSDKIVLAGYSLGGATTLYSALTCPYKLGAALAISCWLPLRNEFPNAISQASRQLRLTQIQGRIDPLVTLDWSQLTAPNLTSWLGQDRYTYKIIDDFDHTNHTKEELDTFHQYLLSVSSK